MKSKLPQKAKILLVDDHQVVRLGITKIINQEPDMEVIAETGDASAALRAMSRNQPDLVITDIALPGMNGIEFLKHLKVRYPELPVIVLSMHDEAHYAERALRAGALAYVMKKESSDEMLLAIRKARRGEYHVSDQVGSGIFHKLLQTKHPLESPVALLGDRELEVFDLLGHGRASREIARELNLSVKTVDTHHAHIKQKLELHSAPEMIRRAVQLGGE